MMFTKIQKVRMSNSILILNILTALKNLFYCKVSGRDLHRVDIQNWQQ